MSRSERDKGLKGEQEVARSWRDRGFTVRGLEGGGDHGIVSDSMTGVRIHSEVKRQETARPWAWYEQAAAEAPPAFIPVVHFRRNRSPWLVLLALDDLQDLLQMRRRQGGNADELTDRVRELVDLAYNSTSNAWALRNVAVPLALDLLAALREAIVADQA